MFAQISLWLVWIVLQCSVVGLLAILLLLPLVRCSPDTRGRLALAGLAAMGIVLLAGMIPGSGWITSTSDTPTVTPSSVVSAGSPAETTLAEPLPENGEVAAPLEPLSLQWQRWTSYFAPITELPPLEEEAELPQPSTTTTQWMPWFAAALIIAQLLAVARIAGGLWALKLLQRRSRACDDRDMQSRLARLRLHSEIQAPLKLAVIDRLQTPAVIGWRRFTILLPAEFTQWSGDQRDAVLAHELAHIARRDGWWRAIAVLLQALHFYNPLAFVLSHRYTLEQELAADKLACDWLGARENYLQSLATLALRQAPPAPAWSTLAFLPSRSMFLRRLEMLREVPRHFSQATERLLQFGSLALLLVAALVVGGLRPLAAQPPQTASDKEEKTKVPYVVDDQRLADLLPNDLAELAVEINLAKLMQMPKVAQLLSPPDGNDRTPKNSFGDVLQQQLTLFPTNQVESILTIQKQHPGEASTYVTVVRLRGDLADTEFDFDNLGTPLPSLSRSLASGGLFRNGSNYVLFTRPRIFFHSPDPGILKRIALFNRTDMEMRDCLSKQLPPSDSPLRVSVDWSKFGPTFLAQPGFANSPNQLMVAPLTKTAKRWSMELVPSKADKLAGLRVEGEFGTPEEAKQADTTLSSLRTLLQNLLATDQVTKLAESSPDAAHIKQLLEIAGSLLKTAKTETDASSVIVTASPGISSEQLLTTFLPAFHQARLGTQRTADMSNLRHLVIAFHNYHDTYGHFPKAVVVDAESGQKRSWRVELLPYLELQDLYEQYRKDEPWDSESNRKLIAQMPPVFGASGSPDRTSASFFAVTGPDTALAPVQVKPAAGEEGAKDDRTLFEPPPRPTSIGDNPTFYDCTDGTVHTVLLIQTKKDVPWTKPEDVTLEEADAAKLGGFHPGGFIAALCDGSARFFSNNVDPKIWNCLLIRNDGEIIPHEQWHPL
ncbi:M56 family metallopeptidase [Blastopirellula marina]|uniref:Uncharacterized protein n=1 Tax=Blastopirellula marina TaxID=124 RepID=A0A2S8F9C6_9BACT|nr:M56 family metallopeptidase [Blastopirellula marina]PQO28742.1 hypothetical protein C5Y98_23460 [Blastopirellula marina]PTL42015.1 DUF1559 domain-containing protein [Blastopirellula marina]